MVSDILKNTSDMVGISIPVSSASLVKMLKVNPAPQVLIILNLTSRS